MKIRQAPKIQHHKNKTFSIKLNRLIDVVANIFHKITKLLFFVLKIQSMAALPTLNAKQ